MKTGMQIHEVMTNTPVTVSPTATVQETALLMTKKNVNSVLVVKNDQILGIVTDEDMVRRIVTQSSPATQEPISAIMVKDPFIISPGQDLMDAIVLMGDNDIRHLPVVDKKKLVGFITMRDILKMEPELVELLSRDTLQREEEQNL
ncbi:MAG: CBS domain-containing protein [archaeon]